MWASSIPKLIEKKNVNKQTLPLEKYLSNARAEFVEQRKQVPILLKEIENLEQKKTNNDCAISNSDGKRYRITHRRIEKRM